MLDISGKKSIVFPYSFPKWEERNFWGFGNLIMVQAVADLDKISGWGALDSNYFY